MKMIHMNCPGHPDATLEGYLLDCEVAFGQHKNRPAVIVCPGGGYVYCSPREGEPVALRYAAKGFHAFILRYSTGWDAADFSPLQEVSWVIGYLRENAPVVVTGRLSLRDDKEPQIVINRARPISDFANETVEVQPQQQQTPPTIRQGTLYLRLPTEQTPLFGKVRAILNMFPGESNAVVYFADTKQRRGTRCALDERMIKELKNVLGEANVVIK